MSDNLKSQLKIILNRHEGRAMAITSRELGGIIAEDERRVRLVIRELIAEGMPVASATEYPAGYFIPESREEAREYAEGLKSRLIEDARRRRDFRRAADRYLTPAYQPRMKI